MKLKNLIPLADLLFASCAEEQSLPPCRTTVPLGISLHARPSFYEIDSGEQNDGSGGGQTRANAEAGSAWADGDRVMLHACFTYTLNAAEKSADIYATLTYYGSAWSSSHPDVSLNGSGQLNASLLIDELATDVGSTAVLYYAPELQWDTATTGTFTITRSDRTGKTSYTATSADPLTLTAGKAYLLNNAIVEVGGITADKWSSCDGSPLETE